MTRTSAPLPLLLREPSPPEREIRRVMAELRLDYIQARNHLKGRALLRQAKRCVW